MVSKNAQPDKDYRRAHVTVLARRLREPRRFINVVAGPRQVGKTTLVQQVLLDRDVQAQPATLFVSADEPALRDAAWLSTQWERARVLAREKGRRGAVLVIDEAQTVSGWSETVKRLWDEDSRARLPLRVVLLGSAPLLIKRGLSESLAGRFEIMRVPHWSYAEMRDAFGFTLEQFLFFGGYPGAAALVKDVERWRRYILDSLIETTISRDVLLLTRVDKPALLRRLFELGCAYSGQILSFNKMLGQLQDAGNTTTLSHYLELLAGAGMVAGLDKFAGETVRSRGSSPKLQVFNTALMTAQSGRSSSEARTDGEFRGRLVESAIGAHLLNAAAVGDIELQYWRDNNREVDFVVRRGKKITAIEVKSSANDRAMPGLAAFAAAFNERRALSIGGDGIPIEEFLARPVLDWL